MKKKEESFATGEFFNINLKGPTLAPKYEFRPLRSWPATAHPQESRIKEFKAVPSLVR